MKKPALLGIAPVAMLLMAAFQDQDAKPTEAAAKVAAEKVAIEVQKPSYPLETCPISGEPLGDDPIDYVHEGRLVRLCCKMCVKGLGKEGAAEAAITKIDQAVIAAQKASYPLENCVISNEKIDDPSSDMEPMDYVHGTRLVRFCCKGCVKSFQKDPAKFMATIDKALIEKQRPAYPLTTCLISGEELGDDSVEMLYGTRLVRLCCKKCVKEFEKNPAELLARLKK
jgi:YHS domain-containing protein